MKNMDAIYQMKFTTTLVAVAIAVALLSGVALAGDVPVTISGGVAQFISFGTASVSGPGISIHYDAIDGYPLVFICNENPCPETTLGVPAIPMVSWLHSSGCVYDQCSVWVTGGFTLVIHPFDFGDLATPGVWESHSFSTTATLSGTVYGNPPPGWCAICQSYPTGTFSLGTNSPVEVNVTVSGVVESADRFRVLDVGFSTSYPVIAHITTAGREALVQLPINADGSSVFKANRGTIPVKFTLTDKGLPTCYLPEATIAVSRTAGGTIGPIVESIYSTPANIGSGFRIDPTACQYIYNLAASSLGVGTYGVTISIDGKVVGYAGFALQ